MSIAVRAFVVGYTGETGKALIKALAKDPRYVSVKLIGRREVAALDYGTDGEHVAAKFSQHVIDFDHLDKHQLVFSETDVGFSALGTTLKKSGEQQMRVIDHDYVLRVAEAALASGCKELHVVSSQGANSKSRFFYLRLKGEIEEDLKASCLFPNYLALYRPGVLLGSREEFRLGERIAKLFLKPIAALSPTWMTTPVHTLAQAMANAPFNLSALMRDEARKPGSSVNLDDPKALTVENAMIFKLAEKPVPTTETAEEGDHMVKH